MPVEARRKWWRLYWNNFSRRASTWHKTFKLQAIHVTWHNKAARHLLSWRSSYKASSWHDTEESTWQNTLKQKSIFPTWHSSCKASTWPHMTHLSRRVSTWHDASKLHGIHSTLQARVTWHYSVSVQDTMTFFGVYVYHSLTYNLFTPELVLDNDVNQSGFCWGLILEYDWYD